MSQSELLLNARTLIEALAWCLISFMLISMTILATCGHSQDGAVGIWNRADAVARRPLRIIATAAYARRRHSRSALRFRRDRHRDFRRRQAQRRGLHRARRTNL